MNKRLVPLYCVVLFATGLFACGGLEGPATADPAVPISGRIEPSQVSEPEIGKDQLDLEYVGKTKLFGLRSYPTVGDVWFLKNLTSQPIPVYLEITKRDEDGLYLDYFGEGICSERSYIYPMMTKYFLEHHGGLRHHLFMIAPEATYVIRHEFNPERDKDVATQEAEVFALASCPLVEQMGIQYDPNVQLVSLEEEGYDIIIIVENKGERQGFGLLWENAYADDGTPVDGMHINFDFGQLIPPGEKMKFTAHSYIKSVLEYPEEFEYQPTPTHFEYIWLGLSE